MACTAGRGRGLCAGARAPGPDCEGSQMPCWLLCSLGLLSGPFNLGDASGLNAWALRCEWHPPECPAGLWLGPWDKALSTSRCACLQEDWLSLPARLLSQPRGAVSAATHQGRPAGVSQLVEACTAPTFEHPQGLPGKMGAPDQLLLDSTAR